MKELVIAQLQYFLVSFAWGILLMFIYDGIRLFRRYKKHNVLGEGVEDILFWSISSCFIFRMSYYSNYGIIRGYALAALAAGMLFYYFFCSKAVFGLVCPVLDRVAALYKKISLKFKTRSSIIETLKKKGDGDEENFTKEMEKKIFPFKQKGK